MESRQHRQVCHNRQKFQLYKSQRISLCSIQQKSRQDNKNKCTLGEKASTLGITVKSLDLTVKLR